MKILSQNGHTPEQGEPYVEFFNILMVSTKYFKIEHNYFINALQKRLSCPTEESEKRQGKQKAAWLKVKFVHLAMENIPFTGTFNCKEALELAAGSTPRLALLRKSRRGNGSV